MRDLQLSSGRFASPDVSATVDFELIKPSELVRLAQSGNAAAQAVLGDNYIWGTSSFKADTVKGLQLLESAARAGDVSAMNMLGSYYSRGLTGRDGVFVAKDLGAAYQLSSRAAELGLRAAQNRVSRILIDAPEITGMSKEEAQKRSYHWCKEAALQGSNIAKLRLAEKYEYGIGVEKNTAQAQYWHNQYKSTETGRFSERQE